MAERDFDVVVFGASGVTGRRVVAYLAKRAGETGHGWAAAARDTAKLERVLDEEGVEPPAAIRADVSDAASLAAMASRARVVLNLVGPYTLYGRPVIEACVAAGTHYADICGEIPFVRQTLDAFHERAADAGLKLVQVCGIEALPPDLAVLLAAETAHERWGERLATVDLEVTVDTMPGRPRPSDGLSGGTLQSMAVAATIDDAEVSDPAALIADPAIAQQVRERSPIEVRPRRGTDGAVIAPMTPAPVITPPVIHRTAEIVSADTDMSAEPFRYREGVALRGAGATLPLRYALAAALSGYQAGMRSVTRASPSVRRRVARVQSALLPSSGFGPRPDRIEPWHWHMSIDARTAGGRQVQVEVHADGHPAYLATARWFAETGLLLAEPDGTTHRTGCLTPATALGTASVPRFEHAQLRFSVSA